LATIPALVAPGRGIGGSGEDAMPQPQHVAAGDGVGDRSFAERGRRVGPVDPLDQRFQLTELLLRFGEQGGRVLRGLLAFLVTRVVDDPGAQLLHLLRRVRAQGERFGQLHPGSTGSFRFRHGRKYGEDRQPEHPVFRADGRVRPRPVSRTDS
jgi:hypothetical protein